MRSAFNRYTREITQADRERRFTRETPEAYRHFARDEAVIVRHGAADPASLGRALITAVETYAADAKRADDLTVLALVPHALPPAQDSPSMPEAPGGSAPPAV